MFSQSSAPSSASAPDLLAPRSRASEPLASLPSTEPRSAPIDRATLELVRPPETLERSTAHAAPLMPLRDRDLEVLVCLFAQDEIEEIDADIRKNLLKRYPEPCWEDDPTAFLLDYL